MVSYEWLCADEVIRGLRGSGWQLNNKGPSYTARLCLPSPTDATAKCFLALEKQRNGHAEDACTSSGAGFWVQLALSRGGDATALTTGQGRSPGGCFCASVSGLTSILGPPDVNVLYTYQPFRHWVIAANKSVYGEREPGAA